jgi:hypothetical protein
LTTTRRRRRVDCCVLLFLLFEVERIDSEGYIIPF